MRHDMYRRQQKCYYNMLFILQAAKMKSWLLILGAAIMSLNYAVPTDAESNLLYVRK
jgi:hypothetical protein